MFVIIIVFIFCISEGKSQINDSLDIYPNVDTNNVEQVLKDWRLDTVACLKLRSIRMAEFLLAKFDIEHKTKKEVFEILGSPNEQYFATLFIPKRKKDEKFMIVKYYFEAVCKDGKLLPNRLNRCWIDIYIDTQTNEVVSAGIGCN